MLVKNKKPIITLIPGSFSVPHIGHWDMIEFYAKQSDYVIVFVSGVQDSARSVCANGIQLTPNKSKRILDMFIASSGLNNVKIRISTETSPVRSVIRSIKRLKDCSIIIGVSNKDAKDYSWVLNQKFASSVDIINPDKTIFKPIHKISASNIRKNLRNKIDYIQFLPKLLNKSNQTKVCNILWS